MNSQVKVIIQSTTKIVTAITLDNIRANMAYLEAVQEEAVKTVDAIQDLVATVTFAKAVWTNMSAFTSDRVMGYAGLVANGQEHLVMEMLRTEMKLDGTRHANAYSSELETRMLLAILGAYKAHIGKDGEVVLDKFDSIDMMQEVAAEYVNALYGIDETEDGGNVYNLA